LIRGSYSVLIGQTDFYLPQAFEQTSGVHAIAYLARGGAICSTWFGFTKARCHLQYHRTRRPLLARTCPSLALTSPSIVACVLSERMLETKVARRRWSVRGRDIGAQLVGFLMPEQEARDERKSGDWGGVARRSSHAEEACGGGDGGVYGRVGRISLPWRLSLERSSSSSSWPLTLPAARTLNGRRWTSPAATLCRGRAAAAKGRCEEPLPGSRRRARSH